MKIAKRLVVDEEVAFPNVGETIITVTFDGQQFVMRKLYDYPPYNTSSWVFREKQGETAEHLILSTPGTYVFDQSDATNSDHKLMLKDNKNNAINITDYTVYTGTAGKNGKLTLTLPHAIDRSDHLYYADTVYSRVIHLRPNTTDEEYRR
tara:strand:- start:876 stop:1325 length:450 start_codon:yes stop_codon:yes gene_type:complete